MRAKRKDGRYMGKTWADHITRLQLMAGGDPKYDLSPNDRAAIGAALDILNRDEEPYCDVCGLRASVEVCRGCYDGSCALRDHYRTSLDDAACALEGAANVLPQRVELAAFTHFYEGAPMGHARLAAEIARKRLSGPIQ